MVSPKNSEDIIAQPLIENNRFLPQYSSTEPTNSSNGSVLTPTGSINFNMSFVFSLLVSLGALLFASTVWYITSSVDYFFFIWHPTLMAMVLLMATQGRLSTISLLSINIVVFRIHVHLRHVL